MSVIYSIFNHTIFQLYLGGIFSLLLTVTIVFVKQIQKRNIERKRLEQIRQYKPEEVGDIDAKLNDSFDFRFPIFFQEVTIWGVQPLFIISFVYLFTATGDIEIIIAFFLVILTLLHEFYLADKFSNKLVYQLFVILIWLTTFFVISYRTNKVEEKNSFENMKKSLQIGNNKPL